ncbi:MAG TPA: nuclear transport factor 2 family protein [Gemmatimonadales bacterium]|nr:nuclear transport factor 2 family protein [Gemmatimonadales bacterium]
MSTPPNESHTRKTGRDLMDRFARGWSKADLGEIVSVFAPEAAFFETPFSEPLRGAEAIRRYWSEVPLHQAEITVTTGEIYSAGPWFATEFKAVFRRRRTGEWVEARGAIFCETEGDSVSEMRMYWHRRT